MAEQLLTRRSEKNRTTRKVEVLPAPGKSTPRYQRVMLIVLIAVGGALIGNLGSQLVARFVGERGAQSPQNQASGAAMSAASLLSASTTVADRLTEIDQHVQSRDFGTALLLCDEALALFPGDAQLIGRRQHAEAELNNRFRYQMFEQAVSRHNYAAALALFEEIPADSTYKLRAAQELPSVRSHLVGDRLAAAQTAARLGQCAEARLYAERVLSLDAGSAQARAVLEQCSAGKGRTEQP